MSNNYKIKAKQCNHLTNGKVFHGTHLLLNTITTQQGEEFGRVSSLLIVFDLTDKYLVLAEFVC